MWIVYMYLYETVTQTVTILTTMLAQRWIDRT